MIFDNTVVVPKNGDRLRVVLPEDAVPPATNAVQVLAVRAMAASAPPASCGVSHEPVNRIDRNESPLPPTPAPA